MAKNLSVENLVENAIDEKSEPLVSDEKLSVAEKVEKKISSFEDGQKLLASLSPVTVKIGKRRPFPLVISTEQVDVEINPVIDFPISVTDQTHALSISEQVRRGIAQEQEPDESSFDFKDGKDDGSEAVGIFDLSNRVDAWIAEQNLSESLRDSFRSQVLQQHADKAMKDVLDKAKSQASQNANSQVPQTEVNKFSENASETSK